LKIRIAYLAVSGLLLGYVGEKEKLRRLASADAAEKVQASALRRVRSRAQSVERARIARELHDGVVQSLGAAELRMDVIRRQMAGAAPRQAEALLQVQESFRHEVRRLRLLTRQMQPSVESTTVEDALAAIVDRFQEESGIAATFVSDRCHVPLSRRARHEIAHIVQEALVNIRKHAGAHHVLVRAHLAGGRWAVSIEDDGCGFPFSGRWCHWELDAARQGPFVIKQRIRALRGTLSLESAPGKGARLELEVPMRF
jgi:two-component system nitrate/nitrite sensor histidine kinase NarX